MTQPQRPQRDVTGTTDAAPPATPDTSPVAQPQRPQWDVTGTTDAAPPATQPPLQWPSPSGLSGMWPEPLMLPLKPPQTPLQWPSPSGLSRTWPEPLMLPLQPPQPPRQGPSPSRLSGTWWEPPMLPLKPPQTRLQGPSPSRLSGRWWAPPWTPLLWPNPIRSSRTTRLEPLLILEGWLMGDPSVEGRQARTRPILMLLQRHSHNHSSRTPPGPQMPDPSAEGPKELRQAGRGQRKVNLYLLLISVNIQVLSSYQS